MNNGHADLGPRNHRHSAFAASAGGETSILRTLGVLRRRKWVFILAWCPIFTMACLFAVTRPMSYRSEASLEVGPDTPVSPADLIHEVSDRSSPPWAHHFHTQEALLRRPGLLRQVLDSLPPDVVADYLDSDNPVRKLSDQLVIEAIPSTFLIQVSLEHRTVEHGPKIVNRLIALFIEDSNRRLHDLTLGVLELLEQKTVPEIRQKVVEAERRVQEFVAKSGSGDITERHASLLESKRRLADRHFEVRTRRIGIRLRPSLEDDPEGLSGAARLIGTLQARRVELELELARQKGVLQEKHATMIGLREQLATLNLLLQEARGDSVLDRDRAAQAGATRIDKEIAAADEELLALQKEDRELSVSISESSRQVAEYQKLDAEVTASRDIYNTYLKKQAEVKAMSGAGVASIRVVDLAAAPRGKQPNTRLILTLGAVLGLLIGAGAVILAEQNDDRAATPYEAEAAVGLDLLVSIPRLPRPAGTRSGPLVPKDDPVNSPLEPFRRLRSEVAARLHGLNGSRIVAILGPGVGEGKSTVAINLARVLGLEGRRVLLVDADFRRPRLKALLADVNALGLEDYLRSNAPLRKAVQATSMLGVDVLGAAKGMEEAPEVPGKPRFGDLWRKARAEYDYIVVDAGSVNAFSEVAGVAGHADVSILVMDERGSKLREVLSARRILDNLDIRILGLIVNRSRNPWVLGVESGSNRPEYHHNGSGNGSGKTPEADSVRSQDDGPMLDRLIKVFDHAQDKAEARVQDQAGLATRESQLRAAILESERDHTRRIEGEVRKNAEWTQVLAAALEASRSHEDENFKKLEVLLTKGLDGLNKKLTDLRLRAVAGGTMGSGLEPVEMRPSQATIDGILGREIETNVRSMEQPKGKIAGKLDSALERLKNLRMASTPKRDEEKKG